MVGVRVAMQGVVRHGRNLILPRTARRSRRSQTVDNTKVSIVLVAILKSRFLYYIQGIIKSQGYVLLGAHAARRRLITPKLALFWPLY